MPEPRPSDEVPEAWSGIKPSGYWRLTEPPTPPTGGVYFVQAVEGGLIKIGRGANLDRRLWQLQASCPVPLRCLGFFRLDHRDVRCIYEEDLHVRFSASRAHGEWFQPTPDLLAVTSGQRAVSVWLPAHLRNQAPRVLFAEPWHHEDSR